MAKLMRRTAHATASQKKRTAPQHIPTSPGRKRPADRARGPRRILPARSRNNRRTTRWHSNLAHYLLRGAAYSTGSGIIGLLFWWLRLWTL
ncbi:hypothetical protein ACWGPD_09870 [Streptomyces hirsutus]|uniref:hypothetical protein n=1 Tax=Streptomyces hirsutus TaxID=35620 RepID=UPI00331844B7